MGLLPFIAVVAVSEAPTPELDRHCNGAPLLCYRNLTSRTLESVVDKSGQHLTMIHREHNRSWKAGHLPTQMAVVAVVVLHVVVDAAVAVCCCCSSRGHRDSCNFVETVLARGNVMLPQCQIPNIIFYAAGICAAGSGP